MSNRSAKRRPLTTAWDAKGFKVQDTVPGPKGPQVIWKRLGKPVRNFPRY